MRGVDHSDHLTAYCAPLWKSLKWYRKLVLHFLDLDKKCVGTKSKVWFRLEAICHIARYFDRQPASDKGNVRSFINQKAGDLSRLSNQHYLDHLPQTEKKASPTTMLFVIKWKFEKKLITSAKHASQRKGSSTLRRALFWEVPSCYWFQTIFYILEIK